jgi:alkylated DNA nucleotide flippase Atl1
VHLVSLVAFLRPPTRASHGTAWFDADGSLPKGRRQRELLLKEGILMRGDRVDLRDARLPTDL